MQERLWKRAAARTVGMAAAAAARSGSLRKTPAGDAMRAEILKAVARVCVVLLANFSVLQLDAEQDMSGLLRVGLGQQKFVEWPDSAL